MNNIAQISLWDDTYKSLADITYFNNKIQYCEKRGYSSYYMDSGFIYPKNQIGFEKIRFVLKLFKEHSNLEWIHFTGCDTLVTNFNITLESIIYPWKDNYHMIICEDGNGINADSFLIRNSEEGRGLMQYILDIKPRYENHYWYEQQALMDFYEHSPFGQKLIRTLPQRVMNSYLHQLYPNVKDKKVNLDKTGNDGNWYLGDFMLHLPAKSLEERLKVMTEYNIKALK